MPQMFSDLRAFRRDPLTFFWERGCEADDQLVRMNVGPAPVYQVTDPTLAREILKSNEAIIDKGRLIYKLRQVIGTSSLTISGPEHRKRRRAIHDQLTEGMRSDYMQVIAATVREIAANLAKTSEPVPVPALTAHLAMRVICNVLFGKDALTRGDEQAVVDSIRLVEDDLAEELFRVWPQWPWRAAAQRRKLADAHRTMSLVVDRARSLASKKSLFHTLQALELEGDGLRDEVLLLILAGHHTTGTAATWLLYHLATEPGLAEALRNEAIELSDEFGEFRPTALRNASVSKALAFEILRLYPSSYWMSRETKEPVTLAGKRLRKGVTLIFSPWHFHRDPRFWDRPDVFDLRRDYTGHAYMPFGYGPKACVGMRVALLEMQLIALECASAFDVELTSQYPAAPPKPSVTLVPSDIQLRFRMRPDGQAQHIAA